MTPCGRFTSEQSAPDFPCGTCGATGLARIHDPEGFGIVRLPVSGQRPTATEQRLADDLLAWLDSRVLAGQRHARAGVLAQFLADFEAFVRSPPA